MKASNECVLPMLVLATILKQGYCVGSTCQLFPIAIGEFGSRLRDCRNGCETRVPNCMGIDLKVSQHHALPDVSIKIHSRTAA